MDGGKGSGVGVGGGGLWGIGRGEGGEFDAEDGWEKKAEGKKGKGSSR